MRKNRTNEIIKLVKKIYEGTSSIQDKIRVLINTRSSEKSKLIQNACNKYLDKLYNQKYIMLGATV